MKIKLTLILAILCSAAIIQSIRIKTDNQNSLLFSSANFKQNDKPKLMESIVYEKVTKVKSRVVRK